VLSYAISGDVGKSARALRDDLRYRERKTCARARAFSLSLKKAAGGALARASVRRANEREDIGKGSVRKFRRSQMDLKNA